MIELSPASQWIYKKYNELENTLETNLQTYTLGHSIDALYRYLWDYYADWYVEYLKTDPSQAEFAKELFAQLIITLHPYMPFETEALWAQLHGDTQLLANVTKDSDFGTKYATDKDDIAQFESVTALVMTLRSMRGLFAIDPGTRLEVTTTNETLLKYKDFLALVAKVTLLQGDPQPYTLEANHYKVSLDILQYIEDKEQQIARTNKTITNIEKQITGLEKKLQNEKFITNASTDVITEAKENLSKRRKEKEQQEEKLRILKT